MIYPPITPPLPRKCTRAHPHTLSFRLAHSQNACAPLQANGRFEVGRKICLSVSDFHPESWRPSWSSTYRESSNYVTMSPVALLIQAAWGILPISTAFFI